MKPLGILFMSDEMTKALMAFILIIVLILCIVFTVFKKFGVIKKNWDKYYGFKDRVEGPIDVGPDIFEFFTMIIKSIMKIFSK